jgi:hypothetical protein
MFWSLIAALLGKEGQEPSAKSKQIMEESWAKFFEACGFEYVGEGFHVQLKNPFWLLLLPIVGTLAAVASEFGLTALMTPKQDEREAEKTPEQ